MNELSKWLKRNGAQHREELAISANTSVAYLYQLAGGHRTPSLSLALKIKKATQGEVTPESFFISGDYQAA